jgi:hypothetical protein
MRKSRKVVNLSFITRHASFQKWIEKMPVETVWLPPNEGRPDVETKNKACPELEWGVGFNGEPVGPWKKERLCSA